MAGHLVGGEARIAGSVKRFSQRTSHYCPGQYTFDVEVVVRGANGLPLETTVECEAELIRQYSKRLRSFEGRLNAAEGRREEDELEGRNTRKAERHAAVYRERVEQIKGEIASCE